MFLLYNFLLSCIVVVCLFLVAEKVSPKGAGIISGLPTGTALTLYFYAIDNGLEFAGNSAIFNMVGLIAMQSFIFIYYLSSKYYDSIIIASIASILGYFVVLYILNQFEFNLYTAIVLPFISIILFKYIFNHIDTIVVKTTIKPTIKVILFRAIIATTIILSISSISSIVGHKMAGYLSAFPTTIYPLLVIIHITYGVKYVHAIIKYVPDGLISLLIYSLTLYMVYPVVNLYIGIILGYLTTIIYILIYKKSIKGKKV